MQQRKYILWLPILMAISVMFGMFLGRHVQPSAKHGPSKSIFHSSRSGSSDKINEVIELIYSEYVDTVNINQLSEKAIVAILEQLDPHSSYIPASSLTAVNEDLQGNFEGIGIEFNIVKDTIVVVSAISGGPSEAVGIRAGDRIVKIDEENVAGIGINNQGVVKRLRGKKGTRVQVFIARNGQPELILFTIKRDKIPLYSLDAAYMIQPNVGYIKINRFAETTYKEFLDGLNKLQDAGMNKLILDLRGNPGGYLNAATDMADEFLPRKKLIVYTEGKSRKKRFYYATGTGRFETQPLVVLIDEGSASASEIVAGALQDNDRALVIGRRSFGKGLVQEQIEFDDGSALRLTVSRYYTPSGRSIQRPYQNGIEKYYEDAYSELSSNLDSLQLADSIKVYKTIGGRTVYGGGGITPDIIIPYDTAGITNFLTAVISKGLTYDFSFDYADRYRQSLLKKYPDYMAFERDKNIEKEILIQFVDFAATKNIVANQTEISTSSSLLLTRMKSLIARNVWSNEAFYYIINRNDDIVNKALNELKNVK